MNNVNPKKKNKKQKHNIFVTKDKRCLLAVRISEEKKKLHQWMREKQLIHLVPS